MYIVTADCSAQDIFELEKECFPNEFWSLSLIEKDMSHSSYFVAKHNNEVVGYICVSYVLDEAELTRIAVKTSYRRNGIATLLIESSKEFLAQNGCKTLILEVRSSNLSAQALYHSMGFDTYAVRKNYYHSPIEDAVLMSAKL